MASKQDVNAHIYAKSPIEEIPVELLIHIFNQCDSAVWDRLKLSHACRRWRHITLNTALLWTKVDIPPPDRDGYPLAFDNIISILRMQLERTRDQPLDVTWFWHLETHDYAKVLRFIRGKAPFSRWRTLTVYLTGVGWSEDAMFNEKDIFPQLESLKVLYTSNNAIIQTICRTTTSNLRTLDLRQSNTSYRLIQEYYGNMLRRVTYLILPEARDFDSRPPQLPPNITALEVGRHRAVHHTFPHIKTYTLNTCEFVSDDIDLKNLTILSVNEALILHPGVEIELHALKYLKCTWITLTGLSKLNMPSLETLHISRRSFPAFGHDDRAIYQWSMAACHSGLLLSPRKSIVVDIPLLEATLTELLAKSDQVREVSLHFLDEDRACRVMDRIFRTATVSRSEPGKKVGREIGLNISTLRLRFGWAISNVRPWKARSALAVKARQSRGGNPSVYASWKGGAWTYYSHRSKILTSYFAFISYIPSPGPR